MAPTDLSTGAGDRRRLAAHLALLLPANKRRLIGAAVLAAGAAYAVSQASKKSSATAAAAAAKRRKPSDATSASAKPRRRPSGQSLKELLPLLLKVAGRKVLVVVLLAVARTALSNRLARLQGYLFRAAFLRRVPLFARNLMENVALCALAAGLEATTRSWVSLMDLQWRRLLTARLHGAYFDDMTYYKLNYVDRRVDSPEARVCEDVPKLTAGLADLTRELVVACVDAAFYGWQLRRYSGTNKYTAAVLAYIVGAGTVMTVAAPNFGGMFKKQAALDGAYRHLHSRLRANAEPIAFYGGIAKEGDVIQTKFGDVVAHTARVLGKQWRYSMVQDFLLKYLGATVAVALIVGPFFGGHMRPEATVMGRAQMLSNMRYHTSVIIALFGSLGTLGASSRKFLKLGAYADRIVEMQAAMKGIAAGGGPGGAAPAAGAVESCEDAIEFENATVVTPGDATLVRELTLRVPAGTNLLVTGPNGAGKSSMFRVLGGLWPLAEGRIRKPGGAAAESGLSHEIFYVPQRPYVTVGTLQDQLLYPLTADAAHRIPADELRALLRTVDLESLLDRSGGGESVTNWGETLSLGEQQRLGMARLFFHKPKFAILDECTSGVTVEMEERFCRMVQELGCTCVTISHRPALMAFHDVVLNLDGEGGWSIHEGHRAATARAAGGAPPPLPSGPAAPTSPSANGSKGGNGKKGKGKKKRTAEVEAVLAGMSAAMTAATAAGASAKKKTELLADGNEGFAEVVLARAPADCASPRIAAWNPRLPLQPSATSPAARWRSVLKVIVGSNPADAAVRMGTVAGVVVLRTLLQDRIASLNGRSVDLVLRQDLRGFVRLIGVSVLQSAASAVLAPSLRHVADSLALHWRTRLTRAIATKYLSGKVFYSVPELAGMGDVDQRLTRDVERLADDLAALIPTMVKPVVDVGWFSLQLWRLCGPRGMAILYAYTAVGYGALRTVTPDFAGLMKTEYGLEGGFRAAHSRLRAHAESVAFFGGGAKEGRTVSAAFDALAAHLRSLIGLRWAYGAADEFFAKQLPHSITWLLTLLYALEQRGDFASTEFQGALVHNIRYLASVVTQCFSAFGELLALPKRFAEISGGINRVSEMLEVVEKAKRVEGEVTARARAAAAARTDGALADQEDRIAFEGVDVVTPGGKILARALTFEVPRGTSVLVTGPNGAGKTSLFRILGGLWPLPDGEVHRPGSVAAGLDTGEIYYVPQKPYTTIGTLREQVFYPLTQAHARQRFGDAPDPPAALDAALDALMEVVRLSYLVEREGGWGAAGEWGETLSLGEQQRLGMARLFFHKPRFGILDECTNATSVDVEEALYAHAAGLGITLVTITQRTALVKYHTRELRLVDGEGDWELREIREAAPVAAAPAAVAVPALEAAAEEQDE
jgi:ABC-type uncharacterized transport system fused permease/ATPase subunit